MTSNHTVRKARVAAEQELKTAEAGDRPDERATGDRREYADGYTRFGKTGQCRTCGTFRTDGKPPTVHRTDCVDGPDGSGLPAVNDVPDRKTAVNPSLTGTGRIRRTRG